jgi:hypothetical protein
MKAKLFKSRFTRIGLKYGLAGTVGATFAASGMAALAAPFGEKEAAAKEAAVTTAKAGLALTGAWLMRKHIARGAAAGGKAFGRSMSKSGKVMFRRIRGRIIPIMTRTKG